MKKNRSGWAIVLSILSLCFAYNANAQQYMRIWSGGAYTQVMLSEARDVPVDNGATLTVAGRDYDIAAIDSITFGARVHVKYSGTTATVDGMQWVQGVTASVQGADVTIDNANTSEELEFVLSGVSQNGSFTYNGTYKTTLILNGLNLKSNTRAAIDIQCGKRIDLDLVPGTDNMLEDAVGGQQKAALYCKGHLELAGAGTLTVKGNAAHAIATKEYFIVKKSVKKLAVTGAAKDGMHIGQYYQQNGGTVEISGNKGDALQVEAILLADKQTLDPDKELNGQCLINGGTLTATAAADNSHVLKADGDITITGGTLTLTATGAGSRCIDANSNLVVNGADARLTLAASGAKYDDGTGDTSRSRLGKIDGDFYLRAGTITGTITKPAKGFKVDGTFYKLGGTLSGTKDGANAAATDLMEATGGVKTSE